MAGLTLLGGLTPDEFLSRYWQKKPLLVRGAFPDFQDRYDPEELAGLACEDGIESRLVLERGGAKPWELHHGPFDDETFLNLPETHWTFLIQDLEKHVPEFADLIEPFRFIPDWRIDDLMVSYAAPQGTVGPHVDNYDVFLIQGRGRRRWQIGSGGKGELLADTELRILKQFKTTEEWVLEPGDLLYLPPGLPHYGVALEPCITYSVGFRAPSQRELVSDFADFLLQDLDEQARYSDPDLRVQDNPGALAPMALERIKQTIRRTLDLSDGTLESWFGRYITEPKAGLGAEPLDEPLSEADLRTHLKSGGTLERHPGARFAYIDGERGESALFVDGQEFALGPDCAFLAPLICRQRTLSADLLHGALGKTSARALLLDLVNEGYLVIYEDADEDADEDN